VLHAKNKFAKLVHLFGHIIMKFATMHGHMNVKLQNVLLHIRGTFCRMCVGHLFAAVATVDLLMAVHRGTTDGSGPRMLHPVHRDEPLHHIRYGHRRVLRSRDGHVYPVLAHMARDGEAAEGPSEFAGRQEGQQQEVQLQVVSTLPDNSTVCRGSRNDY